MLFYHDDVIKLKHFPRYWPFERGIHRSRWISQGPVTQSFDVFFDLCPNKRLSKNREAGDLRRNRGRYDVNVMTRHEILKPHDLCLNLHDRFDDVFMF